MKPLRLPATRHSPPAASALALALATFSLQAFSPQPSGLSPSDVHLSIDRAPAAAAIRATVHVTTAEPFGQYVRASITNDTGRDITLNRLTATLPWPRPAAATGQICVGGWDMGRSESRVHPAATSQKLETGSYILTRAPSGATLAAFVTWKTFHSKLRWEKDTLVIDADGEGRLLKPGETVQTEKVWLAALPASAGAGVPPAGEDLPAPSQNAPAENQKLKTENSPGGLPAAAWQDFLFTYADLIAAENNIRLNRPNTNIGWSTWDYYGRNWDYDTAAANIEKLAEICPSANFVQLDGGWWPARGDYLLVKPALQPDGMKRLARLIRSKNFHTGIHLDGMRGDARAIIAREHPDFFLKDSSGKMLVRSQTKAGDALDYTFFDYSNPAACDYIKRVMRHIRRDWGYDYFKIDFIRFGINEFIHTLVGKNTPIAPHDRSLTSVERVHRGLAAMREGMGADAWFLGCSSVFGPTFGHVDGLRTGADIHPRLSQYKRCALNNAGNFYLHGKVVYNDADYHVVRSAADQDDTLVKSAVKDGGDLPLNEAWLWTHYIALCGGPRLNSDNLLTLRPERRALFLFAAGFPTAERFVPLDLWEHAREAGDAPSVILATAGGDCYLGLFNWTDTEKTITLAGIAPAQLAALATVSGDAAIITKTTAGNNTPATTLAITLPALHSAILKLPAGDFDALRRAITVD